METNFNKPNPKKILGYLMAFVMVFFTNSTFAQTTIGACGDFSTGPNATWTHVLTATTVADGAASQAAQTFTMNVTALPAGGANYRVFKTTANGGSFFGNATALTLGTNTITVASVSFDRAVKFQFSDGTVEFDDLSVNGTTSACVASVPPAPTSLINDCGDFAAGPNATWTHVLTAALVADGASSQAAQTFTMNVTALPAGGANYRVIKTTANGNFFNGNATALTLGSNSVTVAAVSFDRTVKFQFSDGTVEFDALSVNGVVSSCNSAATPVLGCTDALADNYDPAADTDDGTCIFSGCTDANACNYDATANTDDGSCITAATGFDCSGNCLSGDQVTVNLYDSFGDGGGSITVAGNVLTNAGLSSSMDVCIDLSSCIDVIYASTDSWSYENSWDVVDASGAVLASGGDASGQFGNGCAVSGCTDAAASNYDATATVDDGSCTYPCTLDQVTVNLYDSFGDGGGSITVDGNVLTNAGSSSSMDVCIDLSSCIDVIYASTDSWSYENSWDVVDASGAVLASGGDASGQFGNGCIVPVSGCTDSTATNYDPTANTDDGSCTYPCALDNVTLNLYDSWGDGWNGGLLTVDGVDYTITTGSTASFALCVDLSTCMDIIYTAGSFSSENSWDLVDGAGNILVSGANNSAIYGNAPGFDCAGNCLSGDQVTLTMYDSFGDGGGMITLDGIDYILTSTMGASNSWTVCVDLTSCIDVLYNATDAWPSENSWDVTDATGAVLASGTTTNGQIGVCGVNGCTDATAVNFDPLATIDDGSCIFTCTAAPYMESFDTGIGTWTNNGWILNSGATTSSGTGPSDDITGGGSYLYYETSGVPASPITMTSECLDLTALASPCLTFNYHMYGATMGTLEVLVNDSVEWTLSGDQGNVWTMASVDLSAYAGSNVSIAFVGTVGTSFTSDMAIDQIEVNECGSVTIMGCTDSLANNYDPAANTDDGSCIICADNWVQVTCGGGSFTSEVSWTLLASDGSVVATGGAPYAADLCLPNDCYTINMVDSWGDGWNGNVFDISMNGASVGNATLTLGSAGSADLSVGSLCPVLGCTDAAAVNYDPTANTDDGSCQYACTAAPYFENFDLGTGTWNIGGWLSDDFGTPSTNTGPADDMTGGGFYMYYETSGASGNPITMTSECLDISALTSPCLSFNYNMFGSSIGTLDVLVNGTNVWSLSGDQGAGWNFAQVDLSAYASVDVTIDFVASYGGSFTGDIAIDNIGVDECVAVLGCTDPTALNYDASANTDDGSCTFCFDTQVDVVVNGGSFQGEVSWILLSTNGDTVAAGGAPYAQTLCLTDDCYTVLMDDSWGDGWNGNTFDASVNGVSVGNGTIVTGFTGSFNFGLNVTCPVYGCIDTTALNYDAIADTDDGSCIYLCDLYVLSATIDAVPSCNGAADASASVSAPAMVDTLNTSNSFLWDDGQTTSTAVGLAAGTYTCTVTDATTGCSSTISVTIDETPAISMNATASAATVGQTNGSMVANPSGGTPCYTGAAGSLAGGPNGTQWASIAFDVEANTDLALTSIDVPTMTGIGSLNVYYRIGSMNGFEQDPNGWILAGSASVLANTIGDTTTVPVNIPVNSGDVVGVYCEGVGVNVTYGAGPNPAYSSVAFSNSDMNIYGGISASIGAAGTAAFWNGDVSSSDFSGLVNYNLASYTYVWADLTTGDTSLTNSITGLGVGPVLLTVTDCNGCSATDTIFGIEMDMLGCTDATASNYNPAANIDDGSCDYLGCTDTLATNYDVVATIDDGSCAYPCSYYGYDDEMTITLTPDFFSDEISWTILDVNMDTLITSNAYSTGGPIDIQTVCAMNGCFYAHGYDSFGDGWGGGSLDIVDGAGNSLVSLSLGSGTTFESALFSLGGASCIGGCTDTLATNYDATATIDDGSCLDTIVGCTDPLAANTTPFANVDDGSCVYCSDTYANITVAGGSFQSEVSWLLLGSNGDTAAIGGAPYVADVCLADDCYTLIMNDSWGDGWNGNNFVLSDAGVVLTTQTLASGSGDTVEFSIGSGVCTILGCTNTFAVNYDPLANTDDGSCVYSCTAVPYCDNFDAGLSADWTNNGWTIDALGTTSGSTGPSDDISGGGNYMYFETSSPVVAGDQVSLSATCLDISTLTSPSVGFYYHMFGASIGTLDVLVNGTNVWTMSGDQGNQWYYAQADLSAFAGSTNITVEFVGTAAANATGTVFWGDMAIDEVCVQEYQVLAGCTDPTAVNYDPFANTDDGSCSYCTDNVIDIVMYDSWGDGWNGNTYTVTDLSGTVLATGGLGSGVTASDELCLPDGCYDVVVGGGSFPGEVSWELTDATGAVIFAAGTPAAGGGVGSWQVSIGGVACPVYGCTDSTALNFDPLADTDDGSCILACFAAPFCESFDSIVPGSWTNNGWTLDALGTPSFGTGPSDDITGGGNYLFYETSPSTTWGASVTLTTVCLDISALSSPALSFYNHMFGSAMGTLDVLVNGTNVWSQSGDQGNQWNWAQVDLSAYAGSTNITIDFVGTGGTSFSSDMAIDEVCVDEYLVVAGCTDPLANNYNSSANLDDGSCSYCTDNQVGVTFYDSFGDGWNGAWMYVYDANGDSVTSGTLGGGAFYTDTLCLVDGCYQVVVGGGTFDSEITFNFGSLLNSTVGTYYVAVGNATCPVYGCTDSTAANYDALATADDGSCDYLGCTNPTAINYDPNATIDDGSCSFGCQDNTVMITAGGGSFLSEISWDVVDGAGNVVASGIAGAIASPLCILDDCYTVNMYDSWGDGWNGSTIVLDDGAGNVWGSGGLTSGSSGSFTVQVGSTVACDVPGCTDPAATNYDATATIDDGSCTYPCTLDEVTLNLYDSWGDGWNGGLLTVDGVDYTITPTGSAASFTLCVDLSTCIDIIYTAGGFSSENSWDVTDLSGAILASGGPSSGSIGTCVVLGCTDATAANYDATANTDDGSCIYFDCNGIAGGTAVVDSCGTCNVAYLYTFATNGVQFVDDANALVPGLDYNPATDLLVLPGDPGDPYWNASCSGCTDATATNYDASATIDDGSCIATVLGCTDVAAFNYDPAANVDDGSCVPVTLGCIDPAADNYCSTCNTDDGTCIYAGCTDPAADNYDPNANVDDNSCTYSTVSGCTDPAADNYDVTATVDDGSCTYPTACTAKPTGLYTWDVTDTRFRLGWDNMNTANCKVLKYNVRYRETGTTTWTTRSAGAGNGLCNFGLNNTEKLMINFLPNTTYDVRLRVQYCGTGGAWSAWTSSINVTMGDYCPDLTNVTVTTFNGQQNKARFDWDTTGVYEFARLYTRVNTFGASWTVQGGFGIYYPTFFKNIFTFTPGETYRVQANSFCSASLASYRGNLTPPVIWTQPGGSSKIDGGIAINNLDVYPNPSRDVFNVTFTSDDVQDLEVRVLNIVGEVVYTENLEQFVGEYTKAIDLNTYTKGVYFLEITTNDGVVNKKLILQ